MKTTVLQFSGGRDSTAALYQMRDQIHQMVVCYADSGSAYPHVREHVHDTCERLGAELHVVLPEISAEQFTERFGYPSDILPVWVDRANGTELRDAPRQFLISPQTCCNVNLWKPLADFVTDNEITLVLRGVRENDRHRGVPPGFIDDDGVRYDSPIWGWSDDDVNSFVERLGVELPAQYADPDADGLDCWCCTAHAGYGTMAARMKFTREHYPHLYRKLCDRHETVARVVNAETKRIQGDIKEGFK